VRCLVSVALGLVAALGLPGCAGQPLEEPQSALHRRVCQAVVTAYRVGVRPAAIDVEVPAADPSEPATRIMLTGENLPLAEQCLGLPAPRPITPASAPVVCPCPTPQAAPSTAPPAAPPPRPGRAIDPNLDTRT
jgi:hypothetical protein